MGQVARGLLASVQSAVPAPGSNPATSSPGTPVNTVAPVASGNTHEGATLSSTDGTWTNGGAFTYQWQRDTGSGFADISGATSSTYDVVAADSGADVRCVVTTGGVSENSNALTIDDFTALMADVTDILELHAAAAIFDPAFSSGLALDGGSVVSMEGRPISGQSDHIITQGSTPIAPTLGTSPNGRPVLSLDGTQYLQGATALAEAMDAGQPITAISIAKASTTLVSERAHWSLSNDTVTDQHVFHGSQPTGAKDIGWRRGTTVQKIEGSALDDAWHSRVLRYEGGGTDEFQTYIDGVLSAQGTSDNAPAATHFVLGGLVTSAGFVLGFAGDIACCAIVDAALSDPDIATIVAALEALTGV